MPKNKSSIIKVIGVGGGGSNAVSYMYNQGIHGVDFVICNTDAQALEMSPVPVKIQLGSTLTDGMGAGSQPEVGRNAAIENIEDIREMLEGKTKMVFITAGMGGGTGTGGAPVIASLAKELDILTVAIATVPFSFEGKKRMQQAILGIEELRKNVDSLLIICNDRLRELHGNLTLSEAFSKADNVLAIAAKGIAEIITVSAKINVDFKDVNTVMRNSGAAIMGSGIAEGEGRAQRAVELALSSPLLNDNDITGSSNILLYLASGEEELSMDEVTEITDYIQEEAGATAEIIWGYCKDESLGRKINVTIVATGFEIKNDIELSIGPRTNVEKTILKLEQEKSVTKDEGSLDDIKLVNKTETTTNPASDHTQRPGPFGAEEKQVKTETKTVASEDPETGMRLFRKEGVVQNESLPVIKPQRVNTEAEKEELAKQREKRIEKLRELSLRIKHPSGVEELEKEPAYVRRNVVLTNVTPSDESEVSRYTLEEDEEKQVNLKQGNSFLHDNVD